MDWELQTPVSEINVYVDGDGWHKQIMATPARGGRFTMFSPGEGRRITYDYK